MISVLVNIAPDDGNESRVQAALALGAHRGQSSPRAHSASTKERACQ
jgi:hypothetical protein